MPDFILLTPLWLTACAAMLILLFTVAPGYWRPTPQGAGHLTFVALAALVGTVAWLGMGHASGYAFSNAIVVDGLTQTFGGIAALSALVTVLLSTSYLQEHRLSYGEFYALVLLACTGMLIVCMANDLLVMFVGIETMSLAAYVLAGFRRTVRRSQEAAFKYFIYGAFASGFLVFGLAQIFGEMGRVTGHASLAFPEIGQAIAQGLFGTVGYAGIAFVLSGLFFKIAAVPFHMWAPDVYEGAPTPATAFLATGIKTAGFAGLCRFLAASLAHGLHGRGPEETTIQIVEILAIASMLLGNLLAIRQTQIKRMLAYSSIAHAGYLLVGVAAFVANPAGGGLAAVAYYLLGYMAMTLGALAVVSAFERADDNRADLSLERLTGVAHRYPAVGLSMAVFMFALAGMPATTGFFGKFTLFSAAIDAGRPSLAVIGVLASAMGAFYYLRVLVVMYMRAAPVEQARVHCFWLGATLWVCAAITLGFGLLPQCYLGFAQDALVGWKG